MRSATFGAGCFWGVEELFYKTNGVSKTQVGYAGGSSPAPTYEEVCTGTTGHAEVVQLEYDPSIVEYSTLLMLFFENHNPTSLNRQGPDKGTQYRSVIFYHDDEQKKEAEKMFKQIDASTIWNDALVTQILPYKDFYKAEDYHQQYFLKHGSCRI